MEITLKVTWFTKDSRNNSEADWPESGLKITSVLSGQFPWILSGPSQNKVALNFFFSTWKSVLKAKTCATLKQSHTELWVSLESRSNHKIKMASRCCECGLLVKLPLKQLGIFHFRTKPSMSNTHDLFKSWKLSFKWYHSYESWNMAHYCYHWFYWYNWWMRYF